MSTHLIKNYDLVINGGGIVGLTLLNSLLKSPYINRCNILLIEQAERHVSKQQELLIDNIFESGAEGGHSDTPKYSNRVSSLTLSSRRFFEELGVWNHLYRQVKQVKSIKTWNYDYNSRIDFQPSNKYKYKGQVCSNEDNTLFTVAENSRISTALNRNLKDLTKNISSCPEDFITWSSQVESVQSRGDGLIEIKGKNISTGEEFTANTALLIGCDGFNSIVRKAAGFKYFEKKLNKTAIVGTIEMESRFPGDKNDIAYQRFSSKKEAVAALLPLDNQFSSFVISCPTDYAERLLDMDDESFIEEVNSLLGESEANSNTFVKNLQDIGNLALDSLESIRKRLSGIDTVQFNLDQDLWHDLDDSAPRLRRLIPDSRAAYPLHFGTTSPYMASLLPNSSHLQVALIGDASHRVHPLAGQGLNLGIMDALVLSTELELSAKNGENIFNPADLTALEKALNRFQKRRQLQIMPLLASIHALPTLMDIAPSKALKLYNSFDCVKKATVEQAS